MEYWESWVISLLVVLIGVFSKFLLEMFLPEYRKENLNVKRIFINTLMTLFLIYLFGETVFKLFTEPWTEDLQLFTLFHVFLFVAFGGFLLIMKTFRIFFEDTTNGVGTDEERAKKIGEKLILMQ